MALTDHGKDSTYFIKAGQQLCICHEDDRVSISRFTATGLATNAMPDHTSHANSHIICGREVRRYMNN